MPYALQVIPDADNEKLFRWLVIEQDPEDICTFTAHTHSECEFETYEAALNAGTLALAAADKMPYENEAADPVGDADCAAEG